MGCCFSCTWSICAFDADRHPCKVIPLDQPCNRLLWTSDPNAGWSKDTAFMAAVAYHLPQADNFKFVLYTILLQSLLDPVPLIVFPSVVPVGLVWIDSVDSVDSVSGDSFSWTTTRPYFTSSRESDVAIYSNCILRYSKFPHRNKCYHWNIGHL